MVRALHPRTIEVTTEAHLTERGDCIIGVEADKGCSGLDPKFREALRTPGSRVSFRILVGGEEFRLSGRGNPELTTSDPREMVIRKTGFVSARTVAVGADKAACDLPRSMVARLTRPETRGWLEMEVA